MLWECQFNQRLQTLAFSNVYQGNNVTSCCAGDHSAPGHLTVPLPCCAAAAPLPGATPAPALLPPSCSRWQLCMPRAPHHPSGHGKSSAGSWSCCLVPSCPPALQRCVLVHFAPPRARLPTGGNLTCQEMGNMFWRSREWEAGWIQGLAPSGLGKAENPMDVLFLAKAGMKPIGQLPGMAVLVAMNRRTWLGRVELCPAQHAHVPQGRSGCSLHRVCRNGVPGRRPAPRRCLPWAGAAAAAPGRAECRWGSWRGQRVASSSPSSAAWPFTPLRARHQLQHSLTPRCQARLLPRTLTPRCDLRHLPSAPPPARTRPGAPRSAPSMHSRTRCRRSPPRRRCAQARWQRPWTWS